MDFSISNFPFNIHKGVRLFFLASMVALITGLIALMFALWEVNRSIFPGSISLRTLEVVAVVSTVLSYCVMALQLIGINQAARDERYFRKATIALIISAVCSIAAESANIKILDLVGSIASLCATLFIIKGVMNAALRLKNLRMYEMGRWLYVAYLLVTFGPIGLTFFAGAVSVLSRTMAAIQMAILICAVASVLVGIWYLVYMFKAIKMTNPAKMRLEEDPWYNPDQSGTPFDNKAF